MIRIFLITLFSFLTLQAGVMLTQEERQWLKEHKTIRIGIDTNFAPLEFIDENGDFKGITADYLKEMKKLINQGLDEEFHIEFDIVKNRTWNEIINLAKARSIDMLSCIVETPERSKYLDFTSVYLAFPMVIVTNKESGYINNIEELKGRAVAVIDNYTPHELLSKYKDIFLVKTKDLTQALELVSSGKTFAHVGNLSRVTFLLKEKGFQNLTISGITQYKYNFSMGVKKGDYVLRNIIQKAFDAIPRKVKTSIYYKWFPLSFREEPDYSLIWKILAGTFVITLAFSFWVFKLNMNIKRRKVDKEGLLEDQSWLNNSLQMARVAAWQWDLETNQIKGNPCFVRILELNEEENSISAKRFKELIKGDDLSKLLIDMESHFSRKTTQFSNTLHIKTLKKNEQKIEFIGRVEGRDIFNNPKKMIGIIKEIKD